MTNIYIPTPGSAHIAGYEYNREQQILRITFKRSNHKYDYLEVPEAVIAGLAAAVSKSKYFTINIKSKYKMMRVQ